MSDGAKRRAAEPAAEHYYSAEPASASRPAEFEARILDSDYSFRTDAGVFSRGALDAGTALLIRSAPKLQGDALDLGCGWGAIGIVLARRNPDVAVMLSDVNARAIELSRANIGRNGVRNARVVLSDGFDAIPGTFRHILSNPPIRIGKAALYALLRDALGHLEADGDLTVVIRKRQGAPSALAFLAGIGAGARVVARGGGYWVIRAAKPPTDPDRRDIGGEVGP